MKSVITLLAVLIISGAAFAKNDVKVLSKQDYLKLKIDAHIARFVNYRITGYIIDDKTIRIEILYKDEADKKMAGQIMVNVCDYIMTLDQARGFRLDARLLPDRKPGLPQFQGKKKLKKSIEKYTEGVIIK